MLDFRLLLDGKQATAVVDAQRFQSGLEVDRAVRHPVPVEHRQDALPDGREIRQLLDVAEAECDTAPVDDDDTRAV